MRPIDLVPPSTRWAERVLCAAAGCSNPTRERKPYCTEHIDQLDYVQQLKDTLAGVEAEQARVRRKGAKAVDLSGITAQEILRELRLHGDRTARRLSRDLKLESELVDAYLRALAIGGTIELRPGNRGHMVASFGQSSKVA